MKENDANVGSIIHQLTELVSQYDFKNIPLKINLLKNLKEVQYRESLSVNEERLLDYLISCFIYQRIRR